MATVPTQSTFTDGNVLTAAQLNSNVRDAVNFLLGGSAGRKPVCRVNFASTLQSVATGTVTTIVFPQVLQDTDGAYSTSTGTYTVATAGLWLVNVRSYWAANATGIRGLWVNHNGGSAGESWLNSNSDTGNNGRANVTTIVPASVGDTFTAACLQNSGGALNFGLANQELGYMTLTWLGS
ncbi:MAG: hypothetical protein ACXV5Q_01405 [Frankiaceae bacterium]